MPGTVVKQNGPFTYLIKVRDNLVGKWHIDQRDDTPREFSKSIDQAGSEHGLTENEFEDASDTDYYLPKETTTTETATHYPERTRQPPDRLIHQDEVVVLDCKTL